MAAHSTSNTFYEQAVENSTERVRLLPGDLSLGTRVACPVDGLTALDARPHRVREHFAQMLYSTA
jgi:hypothetical protein